MAAGKVAGRFWAHLLGLTLLFGTAACGTSTNGDLGVATFTMDNCGGAFNNLITGCDLTKTLATGGKVDLHAVRMSSGTALRPAQRLSRRHYRDRAWRRRLYPARPAARHDDDHRF